MNDTVKYEERKVESYNYGSDFQLLALKEKRGILKNAKTLLKLQRENDVLFARTFLVHKKRNEHK